MDEIYLRKAKEVQEEKIKEILNPSEKQVFKVTICFRKENSENFDRAVELARKSPTYYELGDGNLKKYYVSYTPREVEDLFELFNLIKDFKTLEVLIANKRIPYAVELWLFLMWFYRIK
ncbi:MAG: hypothetical protein AB1410_05475 [Acidobacteriota bacterium]